MLKFNSIRYKNEFILQFNDQDTPIKIELTYDEIIELQKRLNKQDKYPFKGIKKRWVSIFDQFECSESIGSTILYAIDNLLHTIKFDTNLDN